MSYRHAWLQVTVKATAATGLPVPDVFYFGNLVGDTNVNPSGAVRHARRQLQPEEGGL